MKTKNYHVSFEFSGEIHAVNVEASNAIVAIEKASKRMQEIMRKVSADMGFVVLPYDVVAVEIV